MENILKEFTPEDIRKMTDGQIAIAAGLEKCAKYLKEILKKMHS